MAHMIDQTTGKAGMAYVEKNGKPWHGLGQPIKEGSSPIEVGEAAGLLWPVKVSPAYFSKDGVITQDPDHQVMYRGDTGAVLDVTGKGYIPHQNEEVLEFFTEYVETGDMYIDTAGSINDGKLIWVLAKMREGFTLAGGDRVEGYVFLANPHQYGKGMIGKFTTIRIVCNNTMQMALGDGGKSIKVWHTSEFNKERRELAKRNLGIARERLEAYKTDAEKLASFRMEISDALDVLCPIFGGDADRGLEQQNRTITRVVELWRGGGKGSDMASSRGTAWGLLNGVTEFTDHEYGRTVDSRLTNAWLGQGDIKKRNVFAALLAAGS